MHGTTTDLTPVRKLNKHEAVSHDGLWLYVWVEDGSTPWHTEYRPTQQWVYYPSLIEARRQTANGAALQQMVYDCEAILREPRSTPQSQELARKRLDHYAALKTACA
ncbi:hypothetical protein OOJ91_33525 [Micromonospora lupini]|uniref:hypothetical protein n=1 Tax=Micromonospora lupini TaxID=285679 RepID=UPI002255271C|nr:hypothetical protein [Micromonospora lupini]MCX5070767.1 hypothetical protein [Micromonospora lupini]